MLLFAPPRGLLTDEIDNKSGHSKLIGSWSTLAYPVHLPFDGIFAAFLF